MGKIISCRVCGGKDIKPFFDLGEQPLANSLLKNSGEKEDFYPLSLVWCQDCNLVQLDYTVDPGILFSNYVWVTATSETARNFSETFYKEIVSRTGSRKKGYVLEVASNDGTFLLPFIRDGYEVLGVDPAKNIAEMAEKNGVPTECLFFGRKTAESLVKEKGLADIIFARNVLPHVADTRDFVDGLQFCLKDGGVLGIEVHYAKKIIEGLQYDSIYHEHLCYCTLKSLERLLNDFNIFVFDVEIGPISGGSLMVYAKKGKVKEKPSVDFYRKQEKEEKINDFPAWQDFAKRSFLHREKLVEAVNDFVGDGKKIIGYGASARSSTLLNFCSLGPKQISVIADQNPLKQGLFTAGTHIKIKRPEEAMKENPDCILVLAWNFRKEIIDYLREKFNYKGLFIVPLPDSPKIER